MTEAKREAMRMADGCPQCARNYARNHPELESGMGLPQVHLCTETRIGGLKTITPEQSMAFSQTLHLQPESSTIGWIQGEMILQRNLAYPTYQKRPNARE